MSTRPDTIVLIHGFWVTPRSWEDWITHYEGRGYRVLAPAYPGFEVEVEALNADVVANRGGDCAADHRASGSGGRWAGVATDSHWPFRGGRVHPGSA